MVNEYHSNEATTMVWTYPEDHPNPHLKGVRVERVVCPECYAKDHKQGDCTKVYDCKNTFYRKVAGVKETVGQCCCYSEVHGVVER